MIRTVGLTVGMCLAMGLAGEQTVGAGVWRCPQADGTVRFSDAGGPGCKEMSGLAEVPSVKRPGGLEALESPPAPSPGAPAHAVPSRPHSALSAKPFAPSGRTIPTLYYTNTSADLQAKGFTLANKGDIAMVQIDVSFLPQGNGPVIATDHHFLGEAREALGHAALAAANAVRYDPRYLSVRMTMPMESILHAQERVDGPSAGVAFAVAITAALLGDMVRTDVCMSGTILPDMRVGPVGGLEDKIDGCHRLPNFHELLLPTGQNTFAITQKGLARSMKVTEVATLAEAYELATGQLLRPL